MQPSSRLLTPSITLHSPADTGPALTPAEIRTSLQDCADRKDWPGLNALWRDHPDTFRDGPRTQVLTLHIDDSRDLGDFADMLPPEVHLPVILIRHADLTEPDQRLARLTAHPHSLGLQLDDCAVSDEVFEILASGARQGQDEGHPGLRVLACTSMSTQDPDLGWDEDDAPEPVVIRLDRLIEASPRLEDFALSGTLDDLTVIAPANVFAALAHVPLKRLALHGLTPANFSADTDDPDCWVVWKEAQLPLEELVLDNCAPRTSETGQVGSGLLEQLFCASTFSAPRPDPLKVICRSPYGMDPRLCCVLGARLHARGGPLHLELQCRHFWTAGLMLAGHGAVLWQAGVFVPVPKVEVTTPVHLTIDGIDPASLGQLASHIDKLPHLTSLRLTTRPGPTTPDPGGSDGMDNRTGQDLRRLLASLRRHQHLNRLVIDPQLLQGAPTGLRQEFRAVGIGIELDRRARHLLGQGYDIGLGGFNRDISPMVGRHLLESTPDNLGRTVLPLALTNRTNHALWAGEEDRV